MSIAPKEKTRFDLVSALEEAVRNDIEAARKLSDARLALLGKLEEGEKKHA